MNPTPLTQKKKPKKTSDSKEKGIICDVVKKSNPIISRNVRHYQKVAKKPFVKKMHEKKKKRGRKKI